MSFFASESIIDKINLDRPEKKNNTIVFIVNNSMFTVKKIKFCKTGYDVKVFSSSEALGKIMFEKFKGGYINIDNKEIQVKSVKIKSVKSILEHQGDLKYIVNIKAQKKEGDIHD